MEMEISADVLVHANITADCMRTQILCSASANLLNFEWCIIHAEYTSYAKGYTTVV